MTKIDCENGRRGNEIQGIKGFVKRFNHNTNDNAVLIITCIQIPKVTIMASILMHDTTYVYTTSTNGMISLQ